ncbi:MAG: sulfotransferase domain-containing protein, partial [bacterium]
HADNYRVIGEISPQYLEREECPERIFKTLPNCKLIVMLRHPVSRAYSQYGLYVQRRNYKGSFEDFVAAKPRSLERGFYSRYLKRYLSYFDRTRILTLIFEDAVKDVDRTKRQLADFLGIAAEKFPTAAGLGKVNPSSVPRSQFLYALAARIGRLLREWDLEPLVDAVMRSAVPHLLAKGKSLPPLDREVRVRLSQLYQEEFAELERCMGIDLSCWRN